MSEIICLKKDFVCIQKHTIVFNRLTLKVDMTVSYNNCKKNILKKCNILLW